MGQHGCGPRFATPSKFAGARMRVNAGGRGVPYSERAGRSRGGGSCALGCAMSPGEREIQANPLAARRTRPAGRCGCGSLARAMKIRYPVKH